MEFSTSTGDNCQKQRFEKSSRFWYFFKSLCNTTNLKPISHSQCPRAFCSLKHLHSLHLTPPNILITSSFITLRKLRRRSLWSLKEGFLQWEKKGNLLILSRASSRSFLWMSCDFQSSFCRWLCFHHMQILFYVFTRRKSSRDRRRLIINMCVNREQCV